MTTFENIMGFLLLILAVISIVTIFRILYVFYVNNCFPPKVSSVAYILTKLPDRRIHVLVLTILIIASATLTFFSVILCLFVTKEIGVFRLISIGTATDYLMLIIFIHTMKKYEIKSVIVK